MREVGTPPQVPPILTEEEIRERLHALNYSKSAIDQLVKKPEEALFYIEKHEREAREVEGGEGTEAASEASGVEEVDRELAELSSLKDQRALDEACAAISKLIKQIKDPNTRKNRERLLR
jgi:hypothetical protein